MMKRTKKQLLPSIGTLLEELLTKVLARVGSSIVIDLFNMKLSCKEFYRAGVDAEVLRRVSLEKLPAIPWRVKYFSRKKQELRIELLKKATYLGHEEAAYMLGLILLCTNYPFKA
ncbi:uncharacterized protein LOC122643550 [Telopea speciosissima]|uniref:uncharacterized protein LOC122643550 n=1 Tax=Telopea speciosissima TaxID=54955 RepID=UPI001CC7FCC3|nr:uncharacterized protein LOC122643550 [Telopea speciosissima]